MLEQYLSYFAITLIVVVLLFLIIFESLDDNKDTSSFGYVLVAYIMFATAFIVSVMALTYNTNEMKQVIRRIK